VNERYDLVIFDCDGVLVDSEPISNRILAEHLTALGVPTTPAQSVERYMGGSVASMLADVERRLGRAAPANFGADYRRACFAAFDEELEAVDGIRTVLDALDATTTRTCVASSGEHERIRHTLGLTGLLERFEGRIFSATDVARGKPAPDLFEHAAAEMGADPRRCAVVEDSPKGVAAARAAGMAVFAYAARTPREQLEGDNVRVFSRMGELPGLLTSS
jgi:HAD superfamily hydrolase (TIGR01509 family)